MMQRGTVPAFVGFLFVVFPPAAGAGEPPTAVVREAPRLQLPGVSAQEHDGSIDCNSPLHWDGATLYIFMSTGHPYRSHGLDLAGLSKPSVRVSFDNEKEWKQGGRWIEATYKDDAGPLYMWYHNEPPGVCPDVGHLTAPRIGCMVADDNGLKWRDLGLVMEAPADSKHCGTANHYFAGGNGDFCVNVDNERRWVYIFTSTYNRDLSEQGVVVARLRYQDLKAPQGKVYKFHQGEWKEPGIGGHVTPIFKPAIDWHKPDANALWGPSIHWNTHLKQWVMLLNRAKDKDWAQEGIYVSFNADLGKPDGWSKPVKILDAAVLEKSKWYPQVIGTDTGRKETDKLAGRTARLFVAGLSKWEITFGRPGDRN